MSLTWEGVWHAIWKVSQFLTYDFVPSLLRFVLFCGAVVAVVGLVAMMFFRDESKSDGPTKSRT